MEMFLDALNARRILDAASAEGQHRSVAVSLDLNLSRSVVEVDPGAGCFRHQEARVALPPLEEIAEAGRKVFRKLDEAPWQELQVFSDGYHHLVSTSGAPTLEIDGVQMHRTARVDPFEGAREWAVVAVSAGDQVLDTCGGLGYTAIQAARLGAARVVSTEPNEAVALLRALNPWSRLAKDLPIELHAEDAFARLSRTPPGSFDSAIHDPPRFSLAPELYSAAFYLRLHDVLRPGGRMFHYTGSPYSKGRGRDFLGGVLERLRGAGFRATPREDLQGFVCTKAGRR